MNRKSIKPTNNVSLERPQPGQPIAPQQQPQPGQPIARQQPQPGQPIAPQQEQLQPGQPIAPQQEQLQPGQVRHVSMSPLRHLIDAAHWQWILSAVAWILIWEILAGIVGKEILLAKPLTVAQTLFRLAVTPRFWSSVAFSVGRIGLGFLLAMFSGILLAACAHAAGAAEVFLKPVMSVIKAAPVASYIILCLLFTPSHWLATLISFTMSLPVVYTNILIGLQSLDHKLNELAAVYRISFLRRLYGIYFSQMLPHLLSACSLALGLCWKAGIAAEVIGLPRGSIGEALYQAKIFVDTPSVMAWTAVVIVISYILEKLVIGILRGLASHAEKI